MQKPVLRGLEMQRDETAFPILQADEIEAARECGRMEVLEIHQSLFEPGQNPMDFFVVVRGAADIIDTSGDEDRLIVTHSPGAIILDETRLLLVRSARAGATLRQA